MAKVLVVFNTCEINESENWSHYAQSIQNLLNQDFRNFVLVVSGCKNTKKTKEKLTDIFGHLIAYNWIDDILPLNITFNHTVRKCWDHYGEFDAVLYVDSGINVSTDKYVLERLYRRYATGKFSMVAHRTDTDTGYDIWNIPVYSTHDTVIPVGKTVNLHCQMFGKELFYTYDRRILPDIFASDTSESIYSFMCAAVGKRMVLCHENWVHHRISLDGASSGFRNKKPLLFQTPHTIVEICNEGYQHGFGYEELVHMNGAVGRLGRHHHNPQWYDQDGKHKDPSILAKFIREWCFIDGSFYDQIQSNFSPSYQKTTELNSPHMTCIIYATQGARETIKSVLNQTSKNFELFVYDHGKTVKEIPDKRVKVLRSTHDMISSFSSGLSNANGSLIMYLSDNDVLYPNAFESFIEYAKQNPHCKAMYATQDLVTSDETPFYLGERKSSDTRGNIVGGKKLDGQVDLSQVCHITKTVKNINCWSTEKVGCFLENLGNNFPVYPVDAKIGMKKISI